MRCSVTNDTEAQQTQQTGQRTSPVIAGRSRLWRDLIRAPCVCLVRLPREQHGLLHRVRTLGTITATARIQDSIKALITINGE